MNRVILMGMKHCGKSSQGRSLAHDLDWNFYDLDDLIEEANPRKDALTVRDIYNKFGKDYFQQLEATAALQMADTMEKGERAVLALGGGTIMNKVAMDALCVPGPLVYLEEDVNTLFDRIIKGGIPAFLSSGNPFDDFIRIYKERTKLYDQYAHIKVNLHGLNKEEAYEKIKKTIEEYEHAR